MKTIYFTTALIFLAFFSATAQQQNTDEKTNKWKVGFEIGTIEPITETGYDILFTQNVACGAFAHEKSNSSSFGLNCSYLTKSGLGFRFSVKDGIYKASRTFNNTEVLTGNIPDPYIIDTFSVKQSSIIFSPGIFWNYSYKIINLYGGFQMVYRNYSAALEHQTIRQYNAQTNSLESCRYYDIKLDGGYSIGIAPFVGFSANVFKGISIGAEFSSAYSYYHTGGKYSFAQTDVYPSSTGQSYTEQHTFDAFKFSRLITSINLSYSF